jgi:hypothetical protein
MDTLPDWLLVNQCTTRARTLAASPARRLLGAPSGTKSLLGELKVADLYNRSALGGLFSDLDLCRMVTSNPADALVGGAGGPAAGRVLRRLRRRLAARGGRLCNSEPSHSATRSRRSSEPRNGKHDVDSGAQAHPAQATATRADRAPRGLGGTVSSYLPSHCGRSSVG